MVNTKNLLEESTASSDQLIEYKRVHVSFSNINSTMVLWFSIQEPNQLTTDYGRPISDRAHVMSVGAQGPLLLADFPFIEDIQRFNRERIPERVVHGKG